MSDATATSPCRARTLPRAVFSIALAASSRPARPRATMATSAPDAANRVATASPIPLLPPVMMAARPVRSIFMSSLPAPQNRRHWYKLAPPCSRAKATSMHAVGEARRFPQLTMDGLDDRQRPLADQIMQVSSIGIAGPYNPMLRSPVFGQRMFDLLRYLRWDTSLPLRLNEFAILIVARHWRSQVEWFAHAPLAEKAGLSPALIAELKG